LGYPAFSDTIKSIDRYYMCPFLKNIMGVYALETFFLDGYYMCPRSKDGSSWGMVEFSILGRVFPTPDMYHVT
jgi:hypothetical protein